ncbi:MAG: hypothetical protein J6I42_01650, partial [Clostridia bacterium]|nr:hypothetical protein [Clostridia bacterium]
YLLFLRAFFPLFHSKSASSELIFSWMHLGGFVLRYLIDIAPNPFQNLFDLLSNVGCADFFFL